MGHCCTTLSGGIESEAFQWLRDDLGEGSLRNPLTGLVCLCLVAAQEDWPPGVSSAHFVHSHQPHRS